jgi:two-component system LytT family response regulator
MEEERLAEALETVHERAALSSAMNPAPRPDPDESEEPDTLTADDQVFIRDGYRCWFVRLGEVRLFEATGNYPRLHFDGEEPPIDRSMIDRLRSYLEERLDPERYSRASRPHILNLEWIEDMSSPPNGKLLATSLATSAWNSSTAAPAHSPPALAIFAPLRTAPSQL